MSHKPDRTLRQVFQHPIAVNIKWRDIVHLLESLGAEVETIGGHESVRLNGEEQTFRIPHGKTLDNKDHVVQIRHFLERAGVKPG
jgi:hypothetical protein